MTPRDRAVAISFAASAVAGLALMVVFAIGGEPQAEGPLLAVALGGIGTGLVVWSHDVTGDDPAVEDRLPVESPPEPRAAFLSALESSSRPLGRRHVVLGALAAAGASLGAALLLPMRALGPTPGRALFRTAWRPGSRLVTGDGKPVRAGGLGVGNIVTVFPEGATDAEDSATLVIRVEPGLLRLPAGRDAWAPNGVVAYSKICTHVGCPVGLYRESTHELLCPCHQSTFDVLRGAHPVFGPATRALPQLPIAIDAEGYLVATSDYQEPIGPGFWNRGT
jgi:ubiquinol-cytochrome c reductase iron-sulfur subunit